MPAGSTVTHAAPAHEPKPPDHVNPVDPSKRGGLASLSKELATRAGDIYKAVASGEAVDRRGSSDSFRAMVDKAAEYSVGLDKYWKFVRGHASDAFIYRTGGSQSELDALNRSIDNFEHGKEGLVEKLRKWAELTSPLAEEYDAAAIEKLGKDLSDFIKGADDALNSQIDAAGLTGGPEALRRIAFWGKMRLALSGVAEQIGSQIETLSKGDKLPDKSMANETILLMNRAGKDDRAPELSDRAATLDSYNVALRRDIAETLNDKLERFSDLERQQRELDKNDPEYKNKWDALEKQKTELGTEPFRSALAEFGGKDLKTRLYIVERALKTGTDLTPGERASLLKQREQVLDEILKKLQPAVAAEARIASSRSKDYQQWVGESQRNFDKDPYRFWSKTKSKFLDAIQAVTKDDTSKKLDGSFSGDFSGALKSWADMLKNPKAKPEELQSAASEVVTMADSYLQKLKFVLKDADSSLALSGLRDNLVAALNAIRLNVSKDLTAQFDNGRFN